MIKKHITNREMMSTEYNGYSDVILQNVINDAAGGKEHVDSIHLVICENVDMSYSILVTVENKRTGCNFIKVNTLNIDDNSLTSDELSDEIEEFKEETYRIKNMLMVKYPNATVTSQFQWKTTFPI